MCGNSYVAHISIKTLKANWTEFVPYLIAVPHKQTYTFYLYVYDTSKPSSKY